MCLSIFSNTNKGYWKKQIIIWKWYIWRIHRRLKNSPSHFYSSFLRRICSLKIVEFVFFFFLPLKILYVPTFHSKKLNDKFSYKIICHFSFLQKFFSSSIFKFWRQNLPFKLLKTFIYPLSLSNLKNWLIAVVTFLFS